MHKPSKAEIKEFLTRGVEDMANGHELEKILSSDQKITAYLGIDPTGADIHLGHSILLRKMRTLQDWGHRVILLIGDFTAMIGDPTGRDVARKPLTSEEVLENAKDYQNQASKILRFDGENPVSVQYNSKWLSALNFGAIIDLASNFTVQQMLERDMFKARINGQVWCEKCSKYVIAEPGLKVTSSSPELLEEGIEGVQHCQTCGSAIDRRALHEKQQFIKGQPEPFIFPKPIWLHEFFYPLMQAYDSVHMAVDLELGGTDQLFNMHFGRTLMRKLKGKEKFVLAVTLLKGSDGRKMGKSFNNHIPIAVEPKDMYGRIMSIRDDLLSDYFWLCTDVSKAKIDAMEKEMKAGANPRDFKMALGREIVTMYHSEEAAKDAEAAFIAQFQKGAMPDDMPEVKLSNKSWAIVDLLMEIKLVKSKSDARRLINEGAIKMNGEPITQIDADIVVKKGDVLQKGKRDFRRLTV